MGRFIKGADRRQATWLPETLDDYVTEDNPVRAVDAIVDALDLAVLGLMASCRRRPGVLATILRTSVVPTGWAPCVFRDPKLNRTSSDCLTYTSALDRIAAVT
jgi:hypothetical protein